MDMGEISKPGVANVHRSPFSGLEIVDPDVVVKPVNRQLFANSVLHDDPVVEAERNDPDRLFACAGHEQTYDLPTAAIIHEKPEHRLIVYLKAQGHSNKEIADRTGYTQAWISQLTRQPWFRLRLVQELKEAGVDAIESVLKSTALDSVFTLVDLRDDNSAPKAVRAACANSLLDRFRGKPVQTVQHEEKRLPKTSEISAIDNELAELDSQLKPTDANKV